MNQNQAGESPEDTSIYGARHIFIPELKYYK